MISSIRADGETVCMTIDSATDGDVFNAYVKNALAPSLRSGDIVVMDNLGAHKRPSVVKLIQSTGAAVEYLPPYSPDLNPIEKMWSKVKQSLRNAKARTSEELNAAITAALNSVSPSDALAWFSSCGYNIS